MVHLGRMRPRFVGRLGPADAITVANAGLGFVAVVVAPADPGLAARLVLLAAMGDGLDGVVARLTGPTPVGEHLDSLSDVAAFGVAPAVLVVAAVRSGWGLGFDPMRPALVAAVAVAVVFLGTVVVRLGFYTVRETRSTRTTGVPSTLAATVISATLLAGVTDPTVLLGITAALSGLMVVQIRYPDLLVRDVVIMGTVQGLAVLVPGALDRAFPTALLLLSLAYLVLAPRFYWRAGEAK